MGITPSVTAAPSVDSLRAHVASSSLRSIDYSDTARSARRAGAILAAPSNDWFGGFEVLHHKSAVWAAVMGGVPIVRSTGHGISSVYDSAGHVLKQQNSAGGPVVLVADVRG